MLPTLRRNAIVRIVPFAVFMLLLALRGIAPSDGGWGFDARWLYGATVSVVGALLLAWRHEYGELSRQNLPSAREALWAVAVGLVVFGLWISLDHPALRLGRESAAFHPVDAQGSLDWTLIVVRWIGAALLVPVMEELFWRSFLMRWIAAPDFQRVDPAQAGPKSLVVTIVLFGFEHNLWLAGMVAGAVYGALYMRHRTLWSPILAHAVTNGLLGIWVIATGNWSYW
jgi:CAAX prenyl protease-like protein